MAAAGMEAGSEQRRRVRRSALLWGLIAAAFYVGFIVMAVVRGTK
jgi:predicted nucleic acid-binding Zn ribbon protein